MMLKKRLTLNGNISSVNGSTNFVDGKYYHFYDRMLVADEDVPGLYQQLLASAKQTIAICDPYSIRTVMEFSVIYSKIISISRY